MRIFSLLFIIGIIIVFTSCRSDFETVASTGDLKFSRDTVYLDTVFTNVGSSTYQLKVYNKSKKDINIPTIQLAKGLNSKYRMTVDGRSDNNGKLFQNVTLLAKDSLYIFIETTAAIADANPADFLYTDQLQFDSGANQQNVELVTLIQDAVFLYPQKFDNGTTETLPIDGKNIYGFYLDENDPVNGNELQFTNQKPYVIYGYAAVPENKTVVFEAGSRIHFHANSGMIVSKDATLKVNGTMSTTKNLENEVIFEGDRLEPDYSDVPGQWGTIWLTEESIENEINHLTIKNATVGLFLDKNNKTPISIKNTQIYNSVTHGILAHNAIIKGENIVINNAGLSALSCLYGGNYDFTHCTFNNNWSSSEQVTVTLSNILSDDHSETNSLTLANFNNSIIYGSYSNALLLNKNDNAIFNYKFNNCLIKSSSKDILNDTTHYESIIINEDPNFFNVKQNKLNIDKTSSAFTKGNENYLVPVDIVGKTRTLPPDLGAYQNADFPENP